MHEEGVQAGKADHEYDRCVHELARDFVDIHALLNGVVPPQGEDWLVTVPQREGSAIFMVFVTPQSDFACFQSTCESMLKSVQFR